MPSILETMYVIQCRHDNFCCSGPDSGNGLQSLDIFVVRRNHFQAFFRIGYLFAKSAFDHLREKMDPRKVNGAVFLGLNGMVIKSHGSTDAEGFAAAIEVGHDMAANGVMEKIENDLRYLGSNIAAEAGE